MFQLADYRRASNTWTTCQARHVAYFVFHYNVIGWTHKGHDLHTCLVDRLLGVDFCLCICIFMIDVAVINHYLSLFPWIISISAPIVVIPHTNNHSRTYLNPLSHFEKLQYTNIFFHYQFISGIICYMFWGE